MKNNTKTSIPNLSVKWFQAVMTARENGLRTLTPPSFEPRSYAGLIFLFVLGGAALIWIGVTWR